MSKASSGNKKKKNPDSNESLTKNHQKNYEMYCRINLVLANRLQLLLPRSNIL